MYGLLGKKLSHSFSKEIHEQLQPNKTYELIELDDLAPFFKSKNFKGLNVTIPYKNEVIQYLDQLDAHANALGSVNTIINKNGYLRGYNTDYFGLEYMLEYHGIKIENQVVIILGNGSTSRTIQYLCKQKNAKKVYVVARNPKENEYDLKSLNTLNNASIIFNSTPRGMFPNNYEHFDIDFKVFDSLSCVIDVIYNPLHTDLLIQAKKHNIKTLNGLMMLVAQAFYASELFHNETYNINYIYNIYLSILKRMTNLVLIGMPMSGKTHYTKLLAKSTDKKLVDIDRYIEESNKKRIPDIFKDDGEEVFRYLETLATKEISKSHGLAISTGGGIVLNQTNIDILKQNGIIIFLDVPLETLKKGNPKGRPLLQDKKNIQILFENRYYLYKRAADIIISKKTFNEAKIMEQIEVKLDEYFNTQWT